MARQPDGYPNLNVPVPAATEQISEEERAKLVEELAADREQQAGGATATDAEETERLRRLALQHGEETLKQIETMP